MATPGGLMDTGMCGRCYREAVQLVRAPCNERPEQLKGAPIGQYHCPDCGAMLLAGLPHPDVCRQCEAMVARAMRACR